MDGTLIPRPIHMAVRLMWVGAGLAALGVVVGLSTRSDIRHAVIKANPSASATTVDNTVNAYVASSVVSGIIGVALWLWMSAMNRRGRPWARILSTVFFGFATLGLLLTLGLHASALGVVSSLVSWLVGLGALVSLWRPESSAWYRAERERLP